MVEEETTATARQRHDKHVSATKNQHATIQELLEASISMQSVQKIYSKAQREKLVSRRSGSAV
jgi:hypothetical protein